ncbi:methionyl-tRNA formyltransferase [Rummeliibacillus sp. TYF-LIM-RU47]|uniref:methionyl-tRNA formyltransferase n=1 Tax=unclassified Rummeliibacillus TaxID=2622809 RepID=UPI001238C30F|nr:methionyl-tRNA formyltransferase [Rummeliibacillus sp. TYF-LIM-RU47]
MTSIVFMGTPDFSVPILRMIQEEGYSIQAVVTQPDRPVGRKRVLTPPPVKKAAVELGLPVIQPERLKGSEELKQIIDLQPDLIVTAAFGQLLPKELLETPRLGCINVHASLLPKYRGGAPIHQAVIDGEKETGVTIMYMAEKLDAGDIIAKQAMPIEEDDTTGTLFDKLSIIGRDLLKDTLPSIIEGTNERIPQDESKVSFARNISREQERIDWSQNSTAIYNQIRGLHPWPIAYTTLDNQNVKIWWAKKSTATHTEKPGTVIAIGKKSFTVATGEGQAIDILDLQPAGKKQMEAVNYLNGVGSKLQIGDLFE